MNPEMTLPYGDEAPRFESRPVWCGRGSTVIGAARIGAQAWLGDAAVIRADGQPVTLGERFWLGHRSTVHIATFDQGTTCGDRVTVGRNSVLHACLIGSDVVVEDDVVILDGATIGDGAVIEAGATVFPRSDLPGGFAYAGSPAKAIRPVSPGEAAERAERVVTTGTPAIIASPILPFMPAPKRIGATLTRAASRYGFVSGTQPVTSMRSAAGPCSVIVRTIFGGFEPTRRKRIPSSRGATSCLRNTHDDTFGS